MKRNHFYLPGVILFFGLLLCSQPTFAADWDSFPHISKSQHVGIKKRFDGPRYYKLRSCYRNLDSRVDAEYFGALVDVTAESGTRSSDENDASAYAEALYEAWKEKDQFDEDVHVIVAMGVQNRSVGIHVAEKFQKLGFTGPTIDGTVEASRFHEHLKRYEYADAMCSLAKAVDLRLAGLQQEMKQRVADLQETLPTVEQEVSGVRIRVDEMFEKDHPFGDRMSGEIDGASATVEKAKKKSENEPREAVKLIDEVRQTLEETSEKLDDYQEDMKVLDGFEDDLETLISNVETRSDADWEGPQAALDKLAECQKLATQVRKEHKGNPWAVRDCQRKAETRLARADVHYYYLMTVIPIAVALILLALAIWIVVARIRRRGRAMGQVEPEIREWERQLSQVRDRIHRLELEFPAAMDPRETAWEGDSAELDRRTSNAINRMLLLEAEGRDLLEQARELSDSAHMLAPGRLEKALRLLRETTIAFSQGEKDPRLPFPVGLTARYDAPASELLGDLHSAYQQAWRNLEAVQSAQEKLEEESNRAEEAVTAATEAVETRRTLALPGGHLAEPLETAVAQWQQARRLAARDPKRAARVCESVADRLEEVREQAETGNDIVEQIRGPLTKQGKQLRQKIRRTRLDRSDAGEPGFRPQRDLDATAREAERIIGLVAKGREQEASDAFDTLTVKINELSDRLDVYTAGSEQVPKRIKELDARRRELKNKVAEIQQTVRSLARENSSATFKQKSKNLGQLRSSLSHLSDELDQVRQNHKHKQYLSAADQLEKVRRMLDQTNSTLEQFEQIEKTLQQSRSEIQALDQACERLFGGIQERVDQMGVSPKLRELASQQYERFKEIRAQMDDADSDGLDVRSELSSLRDSLEFLSDEIETDATAYQEARELADRLARSLDSTTQAGGSNSEFGGLVAQVEEMYEEWSARLEDGNSGGRALLEHGRAVGRAIGRARHVVSSRGNLAGDVEAQLTSARERFAALDGRSFGYGISVSCDDLGGQLNEAQAAAESGNFADALQALGSVHRNLETRAARAFAESEATFREKQVELLSAAAESSDTAVAEAGGNANWASSGSSLGNMSSTSWMTNS